MAITDAPNLRKADMQNCSSCQFFKMIDGEDGACTKHEFSTEAEYVCDDYELVTIEPLPDMESKGAKYENNLKSISKNDNELRVSNYIVLFGGRDLTAFRFMGNKQPKFKNPDGSAGEFFSKSVVLESDYTELGKVPVNWEHGTDPEGYGLDADEVLGYVDWKSARIDERGVFVERVLNRRKEYVKWLEDLIDAGLVGTSSEAVGKGIEIKENGEIIKWPLKRDTLTVTPMEPRMLSGNVLNAYKALGIIKDETPKGDKSQVTEAQAEQDKPERVVVPESNQNIIGVKTMELEETKLQEMLAQAAEAGATKAIAATEPVKSSGGTLQVVTDEGDREFKSLAEHARAVKDFTTSYGRKVDPRLARLIGTMKAVQGASEGNPADGGILLEPTLAGQVMQPVHEVGPFYAGASKIPAGENSNSGYILAVDETSRVTGSRWGGLRGYRLAEGDALTKSKPKFRKVQWELKKYGVLVYGTDELLKDARQFSAIVEQGSREELAFMMNDDIYRGLGVSGAQGIMNSSALITVTRDTGSAIKGADISAMWQRLSLRSKSKAAWYINPDCAAQLDSLFAVGSTAVLFPYAGYTAEGVRTLYGKPIIETEFNASLNTTGDILLADLGEYIVFEKGGIESASSIHVEFLTDQEVFRYIARMDGSANVASALTPANGSNTTSPFVVLGSAT